MKQQNIEEEKILKGTKKNFPTMEELMTCHQQEAIPVVNKLISQSFRNNCQPRILYSVRL